MLITISRQAASRGDLVARRTADRLNLPLINPEVVARAALRMRLNERDLTDQITATKLGEQLARLAIAMAEAPADDPDWALAPLPAMDDAGYRRAIETMIRRLAEDTSLVLSGYPAQAMLPEAGRAVHALVVAPLATRVQRMVLREDVPTRVAERVVRDSDRDRRDFYRRLYSVRWDDPTLYDCILNTARLTIEEAVDVILVATRALYGDQAVPAVPAP